MMDDDVEWWKMMGNDVSDDVEWYWIVFDSRRWWLVVTEDDEVLNWIREYDGNGWNMINYDRRWW